MLPRLCFSSFFRGGEGLDFANLERVEVERRVLLRVEREYNFDLVRERYLIGILPSKVCRL